MFKIILLLIVVGVLLVLLFGAALDTSDTVNRTNYVYTGSYTLPINNALDLQKLYPGIGNTELVDIKSVDKDIALVELNLRSDNSTLYGIEGKYEENWPLRVLSFLLLPTIGLFGIVLVLRILHSKES